MSEDWTAIAARLGYDNENQMWFGLYITRGWSTGRIADLLGFSRAVVRHRIIEAGIKMRRRGGPQRYAKSWLKLLRMDTRYAIHGVLFEAARLSNLSLSTIRVFRHWAQGGTSEDSNHLADLGPGGVVDTVDPSSSPSTD